MSLEDEKIRALQTKLDEYDALFELQWKRSRIADELWRAEDPEKRANVWPDLSELLTWLMDQMKALRAEAAELRTALVQAEDEHCGCLGGSLRKYNPDAT